MGISKEFIKFSLHNHFGMANGGRCVNDPQGTVYSFDLNAAKLKIDDAKANGFELLGFTNHNYFKVADFNNLKNYAESKGITLLPGVEVDLIDSSTLALTQRKFLHVVLVFEESSNLAELESLIDSYIVSNGNNFLKIEQFCELAIKNKCIVCPHGSKQAGKNALSNRVQFKEILGMATLIPVFVEDNYTFRKNYVRDKLRSDLSDYEFKIFNDYITTISAADEGNYSSISEPTYVWGDATFDALFYAAIIGKSRILKENDFQEKLAVISKVIIKNNGGVLQDCELNFSEGLNAFVGTSGSGKTLFLNLIKKQLRDENLNKPASSSTSINYDDLYDGADITFYDKSGNEIKVGDFQVFEGESLYDQIIDAYSKKQSDILPVFGISINFDEFSKYIDNFNSQLSFYVSMVRMINAKKIDINSAIMEINTLSQFLDINNDENDNQVNYEKNQFLSEKVKQFNSEYDEVSSDISIFNESKNKIESILKKYVISIDFSKDYKIIENLLTIKQRTALCNAWLFYKDSLLDDKLFNIVGSYKEVLGQKFKSIHDAKERLSTLCSTTIDNLKKILLTDISIDSVPCCDKDAMIKIFADTSNKYARLKNISVSTIINYENINSKFSLSIGGASGYVRKTEFKEFFDKVNQIDVCSKEDIFKFVNEFVSRSDEKLQLKFTPNITDDVHYNIEINEDENNPESFVDVNKMSAGQLSKAYINKFLDSKISEKGMKTIILYDQPDNNLEKKFVLDTIANKFKTLKLKYQIFITTHEPLLVINGDANKIIQSVNEKLISTEQKITYTDVSILDAVDKKDAIDKVATLIDGSTDALTIRNELYGGMKK